MIRQATPKDIPIILELYNKGLIELGETNIVESCLLRKVVNSYHLAPCFLVVEDGNIIGMAGLTVVTTSHNGVAQLCDYMFYVLPEHRNINILSELVENIKEFARENAMTLELNFTNESSTQVIKPDDKEARLAVRNSIEEYEQSLKDHIGSDTGDMDEINDNGLSEFLIGGAYIRVLDIPADVTIVSKLWRQERLWIIISGEVIIKTEDGDKHIKAPYIAKAPYGSKIALYTVKATKWAAITGAKTKNLEEIEEEMTTESYLDFDLLENKT